MYGTRSLSLLGVLLGALLAGCVVDGGRGSSGFDITENFIISRVLKTQECLRNEGVTFCPADRKPESSPSATPTAPTPTAVMSPTMTPTVNPTPRVDTGLADGASIACTREHPGAPCTLSFAFSVLGFPPDATVRVASRLRTPNSDWVLSPPPTLDAQSDPPELIAPVSLPVPADAEQPGVQFAVLVFLSPRDDLPAQFAVLADSGADYAFVTSELELELITIGPAPTATATETTTVATPVETPSTTPSTPTATATATPPRVGPEITYFGVARADSVPLAPSGFDDQGRPIYVRPFGYGVSLVVEGRPGENGLPIGRNAYMPEALPDLQIIVSRPLGDGSRLVCDNMAPALGGIPATFPLQFSDNDETVIDAINDLGCRADDGTGNPSGRAANNACTLDRSGDYFFVNDETTTQFCLPISVPWSFPVGTTIVAARLRDVGGHLGPQREIVIRNAAAQGVTPSPAGPTHTPPPRQTSTRPTLTVTATSMPMSPSVSPTPTPTTTPPADGAPEITYLGFARADDHPVFPAREDAEGRPVFSRAVGQGMQLVVEARQGVRALGRQAYNPDGLPDLQIIVSRPLGNGDAALCDNTPPLIGGVPATDPLVFRDDPAVVDAINDLGCKVDDGTGAPLGRVSPDQACTVIDLLPSVFGFVNSRSQVQYCLPIAFSWSFPLGETILAVRVRDLEGRTSPVQEIVLHVGASQED